MGSSVVEEMTRNDNGIFRTIKKWNIPYTKEMESSVHLGNGIFRKEMIYKHQ